MPAAATETEPRTAQVLRTADVRVMHYVLAPGEAHSWHHHTEVTDHIWCLEGALTLEFRDPPRVERLLPGDSGIVPPGTVHRVANPGAGRGRYLLVQGIGTYDYVTAG